MIYFKRGINMRSPIIMLVLLSVAVLPLPVDAETRLSLRECLEIALKNQPSLRAAEQNVKASLGRETQALSSYYPQLSASTGYSESHSGGGAFGESVTKSYTTTLQLDQVLFDFGRTGNAVDAARWSTRSSERDRDRSTNDVILNVKQAYYALLAAKNTVGAVQKRVEQTEHHLAQAQAFFKAGSKPRFDVTRAEVDVNNARLNLITATNNVRIRTIALNNAMGIDPGAATEIEDAFPPAPEAPTLPQVQEEALRKRPELLKAEADIEAAKARVRAEEANYYPTLAVNGAYNWGSGTQDLGRLPITDPVTGEPTDIMGRRLVGDIGNSWNAGIILSFPLFQGGVTRGRVSEARANLKVLESQRDMIRQSILLEVNESYADMESGKVRISVMESSLQKARESLALAQGRYEAGVGPSIEVTDAQLAAVQADTDYIQAQYDYQLSIARLFRAMGVAESTVQNANGKSQNVK
jgi:TolC family type I secretion outer membrane protein